MTLKRDDEGTLAIEFRGVTYTVDVARYRHAINSKQLLEEATLEDVARQCGVNRVTLYRLLQSEDVPSLYAFVKVARGLEIPPAEVIHPLPPALGALRPAPGDTLGADELSREVTNLLVRNLYALVEGHPVADVLGRLRTGVDVLETATLQEAV